MSGQTLGRMIASLRKERGMTQLELAESNGVPVFAVDSSIDNALIVSETKTDNYKAAAEAAAKLCEAIGDSGEVALLVHSSETETGIEREKGFREEIEQNHPNVQIIDTTYVNQDERSAGSFLHCACPESECHSCGQPVCPCRLW